MVMILSRLAVAAAALSALSTVSAFSITKPGGDSLWWVASSDNTLDWSCNDNPPASTFTVLVANKDPAVLANPIAIIGVQNNFDCSKVITTNQLNQKPGTGYTVQLASVNNQTLIYAESQPFEIKPLGSSYPASTQVLSSGTSSASATATGAAANNSNAASRLGAGVLAGLGGVVGLLL